MSAETLKFFEDKSTESIINWMMTHLTEEQIRMCLDTSGVPDSSVVREDAVASTSSISPSPVIAQLDAPPLPNVQDKKDISKKSAIDIFTEKYRKKCVGTQFIIKNVSKEGVEYYEFKEVEEKDIDKNPGKNIGDVEWIYSFEPIQTFKTNCTDEDREILEILKEENMEKFMSPPQEVIKIVEDYVSNGLEKPIPIELTAKIEIPSGEPVISDLQITEAMIKAIKIQQTKSESVRMEYPDLYNRGITMYPIFVYGSEGDRVKHLSVTANSGFINLIEDSTNQRLLNSKFKKIISELNNTITSGVYNPTDNIRDEINQALRTVNPEIPKKIKIIYDPELVSGYVFFGTTLDDEPFSDIDSDEVDDTTQEMISQIQSVSIYNPVKKKVSEMSIEELEKRGKEIFGTEYMRKFKPEKYTNSLGHVNVKYVKRAKEYPEEFDLIEKTPFIEFQGKASVNDGPGRFGEDDEELLF